MSRTLGGLTRRHINWHKHSLCGHVCPCTNQRSATCADCRLEAVNRFQTHLMRRRYEDSLSTSELLDRRG